MLRQKPEFNDSGMRTDVSEPIVPEKRSDRGLRSVTIALFVGYLLVNVLIVFVSSCKLIIYLQPILRS